MPRVEIPLIGPSYTNRQKPLSMQSAINMWPEINPEARNQVALHGASGTRVFSTLSGTVSQVGTTYNVADSDGNPFTVTRVVRNSVGTNFTVPGGVLASRNTSIDTLYTTTRIAGAERGMHDFNGTLYAISGQTLYSIDSIGAHTTVGTIPGKARCQMASDADQMIIVTGSTPYRYSAGTLDAITDPDLVNPTCVAYLNSQFIFDNNNGTPGEFCTSSIQAGLSVDALDFATAESHPDDITAIVSYRQLIYFFGSQSVEPWSNTGTGNPPFARASSGVRPFGVAGRDAVITTSEYIYFLDSQRIPRRSNGLDFPSIGTPALGVEFSKYTSISDCIALQFVQDGQQFVVFTFPIADRTWCYHEPSGSWFQMVYGVGESRHRMSSLVNIYGLNYCADHSSGLIYEYSPDIFSDNGNAIIKQRDTAVIHGGLFGAPGKRLWFDEVEFVIASGETEVSGLGVLIEPPYVYPPDELTPDGYNPVYLLNQDDVALKFYYYSLDYVARTATLLASKTVVDASSLPGIVSDGTSVLTTKGSNDLEVFSWDGSAFTSTVSRADVDNNTLSFVTGRGGSSNNLWMSAKSGAFNYGVTVGTWTASAISAGTNYPLNNKIYEWIMDFRRVSDGQGEFDGYGELYVATCREAVTGQPYVSFSVSDAGVLTEISSLNSVNHDKSMGWDRDTGDYCTWNGSNIYYMTVNRTTGVLASVGTIAIGYTCEAATFKYGKLIVYDTSAGNIKTYSLSGTTPTLIDTYALVWGTNIPQQIFCDPHSNYMIMSHRARNKVFVFQIDSAGMFVTANCGEITTTSIVWPTEQQMYAMNAPLRLTPSPWPDPPTASRVEIVAPYWTTDGVISGNYLDLTDFTSVTFASLYGAAIEGADFNAVYAVNGKRALVNTTDAGNRLQIQHTADCHYAALFVCDSDGDVVDYMTYTGVTNGDSVQVPTGANYYVIAASDTGNVKIKKWDSSSAVTTGSTPWATVFDGLQFGQTISYRAAAYIPSGGISIRFTVPAGMTSAEYFSVYSNGYGANTGPMEWSISNGPFEYPGLYAPLWTDINYVISADMNGTTIGSPAPNLEKGRTYFFNVRWADRRAATTYLYYTFSNILT